MKTTLHSKVISHFNASADTVDAQDLSKMANEFIKSPSMILETQQRLIVCSYIAWRVGDMDAADLFKIAAQHISVISVAGKHLKFPNQ